ncbi:MAG: flotillin family protein [Anaerolineae bacterium]
MELFLAVIAVVGVIFVIGVFLGFYSSRYKKVGPNEVLVISGRRHVAIDPVTGEKITRNYRIVKGGGAFIWPVLERVDDLSLEIMTIDVVTPKVYTVQGVPITVDGVAQVKIRGDDVSIATASEQFLSKSQDEIRNVALQTLEGHLRAILGTLTVEEVYKDRDAFAARVQDVAAGDLANMGLSIVSFTIKDIRDDQGYLDALGRKRTAEVKRDAQIGEAEAARDATIASAKARQEGETAKYQAETRIAEAEKDFQVQKAEYDAQVNRKKAEAELAYTLQQNITNQAVKAEEVQVEVVERQKRIQVQEQEVLRKEKELEATVKKPAEAEQYRIQTLANARKFQTLTEAEGQAAAARSIGEGEAAANRARGLAEADIIRQQGFAEAEAMEKKALAWQMYNQAAIIQQIIETLPKVAAAVAGPLSQTDRIVVINSGSDGGAGASKVTQDITNIVAQVPTTIEALTGVNLMEAHKDLPPVRGTPPATEEEKE